MSSPGRAALSILQGYASADVAQFSILHTQELKPLIFVRGFEDSKSFRPKPIEISRTQMPHSDWVISQVTVSALSSKRSYVLEVWTQDKFRKLDSRQFRTVDFSKIKVKILVAPDQRKWAEALSQKPELIFILNENKERPPSTELLWDALVEARKDNELYQLDELIPVLVTADDSNEGKIAAAFFAQSLEQKNHSADSRLTGFLRSFGRNNFKTAMDNLRQEDAATLYGIFDIELKGQKFVVNASAYGPKRKRLFKKRL